MSPGVIAAFVAFAGAGVSAIITYLVAARRLSGKIATSDAVALWAESGEMRKNLTERLDAAYVRIERLEEESAVERRKHREEVRAFEERIDSLERDNATLQAELARAHGRIRELEIHSGEVTPT